MNRLLLFVLFVGLSVVASISEACHRCGRAICNAPVCCAPAVSLAPSYRAVYRTTYKTVVTCRIETRYRKVTCRDANGCCVTKCVPCRVKVQTCRRVPVTTCCMVRVCPPPVVCPQPVSCCATSVCAPRAHHCGLLSRICSKHSCF